MSNGNGGNMTVWMAGDGEPMTWDIPGDVVARIGPAEPEPIRLDIGGGTERPGWVLIDRKVGREACPLPYGDDTVDEIYASHVLEHASRDEAQAWLNEWARVLRPGGRLRVAVPDMLAWAKAYVDASDGKVAAFPPAMEFVWGSQADENDLHRTGFDEGGLSIMMRRAGLIAVDRWPGTPGDCSALPVSLNLEAFKPHPHARRLCEQGRVAAVLSAPRVGFTAFAETYIGACQRLRIPLTVQGGAYWDKGMAEGLRRLVERTDVNGEPLYDYVITFDYDTIFQPETIERLLMLAVEHPEADAIAPVQARREVGEMLAGRTGGVTEAAELRADLVPMETAHFGCTLFRAAALRDLPKPWMTHEFTEAGEYRRDADIVFWHRFREAGRRLFLAPRVPVGHLELLVKWIGGDLSSHYQNVGDYQRDGVPAWVLR